MQSFFAVLLFIIVVIYGVIVYTPFLNWLSGFFHVKSIIQKADAIVVLSGGSYHNETINLLTMERMVQGISLYKAGQARKLICSGGPLLLVRGAVQHTVLGRRQSQGSESSTPDSMLMKDLAIKLGVPQCDILVETRSQNTYENINYSVSLMKTNGINSALLVSSPVHMYRTMRICKKTGFNFLPAAGKPSDHYRRVFADRIILGYTVFWEIASLVIYKIKGWI